VRCPANAGCWRWREKGRSTSTRSRRSRSPGRQSSSECSRSGPSGGSAASWSTRSARASSCRRAATCRCSSARRRSATTFSTGSTSFRCRCRLSDRPEDILPLARHCLLESAREYGRPARRFSEDAEELLRRHPWPGNVRELFHVVQKAALTANSAVVSAADLPASGSFGSRDALLASAVEKRWTLQELSDAYIDETLRRSGGNRSLAAKRLGVSRKFLWERSRKKGTRSPDTTDETGKK